MSPTWARVTDLFGAARVLGGSARTAFLDAACSNDPDLRVQIEALLSADSIDDGFLSRPPTTAMADVLRHAASPVLDGVVLKDRYEVGERLASGGQALVYRATDRLLSRPVVIKVIRAAHYQNAILKTRFEDEMKALSRIDHPAVVGILDVGDFDDGSPFLVLQYIDGVNLRELLERGPIERGRAARILQGIAAALSAAHAAGIAHQDLKPENVMVQQLGDGTEAIKLIDFGIAKIDRNGLPPTLTTVIVAGSVRYMTPEQFEGRNLAESDVYALGLLACELLYGQPDIRAVPAHGDRGVRHLLETAVAYRPQDRPQDVSAWAAALAAAVIPARGVRRPLKHLALVAMALLVGALAFVIIRRDEVGSARIIEKVGALDPLHEGFQVHGSVSGTVIQNPAHTAFVGWSVTSREGWGGYYFHPLSNRQKRRALSRGWILSAVLRPEQGGASTDVDFTGEGRRFDINVFVEPDAYLVRLNTQLVPTWQGLELRLPRPEPAYHKYELRFDAGLETADLWIDGEKRLGGYRGHTQYQEETLGVIFGTAPYKSERGIALFQGVRFEIAP